MRPDREQHLVVGGGIAGIVAALRAASLGHQVTLLEKQSSLGGLLASSQPGGDGHWFDFGTHLPADTGDAGLDQLLFGWFSPDEWQKLPVVKAGNYWNGALNSTSPCVDLRTLPDARYQEILPELLRPVPPAAGGHATLADQITHLYGAAMARYVFEPILRKFYGTGATELAPDAHLLFGLIRFICLDPEKTRQLKQDPSLDRKLAFHSYHEKPPGSDHLNTYYPRTGGVGRWVAGLEKLLVQAGVEIRTNAFIPQLDPATGTAGLSTGGNLKFDRMTWCLPAGMLLRLCGHPAAARLSPPALSTISLYHFVVDRPPLTDAHYVTCYDPALRTFRVTLYDNLQPARNGGTRVTVEVLTPAPDAPKPTPESIFAELKQVGLLSPETNFSRCHPQTVAGGFPIQTLAHRRETKLALDTVANDCPNVRLLGRASGNSFFMRDVLLDVWRSA